MRNADRLALALSALAAAVTAAPAADEKPVPLVLRVEDQANEIWSALPEDPADPRVTLLGDTPRSCAADALRRARSLLAQDAGGRMPLRELSLTLALPRAVAGELAGGNRSAELLAPHVPAGLRSDHVIQPVSDAACDESGAFYDLRALPEAPGRLNLEMLVEAGCGCGRFHIVGQAELEPGILEKKDVLRLRARPARYSVLASCDPCAPLAEKKAATGPAQPVKIDPCGTPCAPLAKGLLAWQQQATNATAKLADLAGKATTIQISISTERTELDAAQATRRKSRPLLERISVLQANIKAAEAELTRITRASQEIQKHLAVLQGAANDTRAADERCQSQCRARQQQRPDRAPEKTASSGTGAGGATAAGGGLSTGVIIAGGAALAAGGVAVATLGGGDDAAPADDGPVSFAGNWTGTRTTTATVNAPGCTRVYDENWVITQTGSDLRADITATAQGCGNQPACGAGCQIFAFPRFHPGTADGSTARFYVFPGLQVPSCVLPLRLQGNTLSGSMPACDTGAPDTLSDVVTLRRSGPTP